MTPLLATSDTAAAIQMVVTSIVILGCIFAIANHYRP